MLPSQFVLLSPLLREAARALREFIVPPTRGLPLWGMESLHSFSHEVLLLRARNNLLRPSSRLIKRLFDIVTSSVLLILLSPVFAVLFYKVHKTDGDAFYGHKRVGVTGVPFMLL